MAESLALLTAFNFLFFWRIYRNPFELATSELLSTFFPSWVHLSRGEKHDPYFWLVPNAHPVLSSYYPVHRLSALLGNLFGLDTAFKILVYTVLGHYLWASLGWFLLLKAYYAPGIAILGAITLTYSAFGLRQQPCVAYTIAWFPFMLMASPVISSLGLGMMLLAGYYPFAMYLIPVATLAHLLWYGEAWLLCGLIIGAIQLIPFLKYLPKTIRANGNSSVKLGVWEKKFYIGLIPWLFVPFSSSRVWPLAILSLLFSFGLFKRFFPRGHERWLIVFQFSIIWMALSGISNLNLPSTSLWLLLVIQSYDIWLHNRDLLPTRPFSELPKKPSLAFNNRLTRYLESQHDEKSDWRISGLPYPLFTGHINLFRTLGYSGGMQLRLMAKFRNDTNPNGSGHHDWFVQNEDGKALDDYRVKFAYTRKRIDWVSTPIRNLYRNPRLS